MRMNGRSCSTKINAPRAPRTFFLKLQSLSYGAGFSSILTFLAFAGAGCQTDTNSTTFSSQADVPRHVRLLRTINGVTKSQVFDLHRMLRGEPTKPFYVRDGDVIYVPQTTF